MAGMGGGTGTGASPVIARESKDSGALTVAVVTKPFNFEGQKRMKRAVEGIEKLKGVVDSLIVIPNERLKTMGSKTTSFRDLMSQADEVLLATGMPAGEQIVQEHEHDRHNQADAEQLCHNDLVDGLQTEDHHDDEGDEAEEEQEPLEAVRPAHQPNLLNRFLAADEHGQ